MGKKRINIMDLSKEESEGKKDKKIGGAKIAAVADQPNEPNFPNEPNLSTVASAKADLPNEAKSKKPKKAKKAKSTKKSATKKLRSKRYQSLKKDIKRDQSYPFEEAISLVIKSANAKFDESVDLNIVVKKESLSGHVKFPHGTGKQTRIVIFSEKIEEEIKKSKTNFDILVARPQDMGKIAHYAKFLGPKGLMPNPKAGTISTNPEKTVKELSSGKTHFKTEKKVPLIHMTIGKISFGKEKLLENLEALINSINPHLIKKAVISSTMSPGIKVDITKVPSPSN